MLQTTSSSDSDLLLQRLDAQERLISLLCDEIRQLRSAIEHSDERRNRVLIDKKEVCRRLNIGRTTFDNRRKKGMYKTAEVSTPGGRIMYSADIIRQYSCNGS